MSPKICLTSPRIGFIASAVAAATIASTASALPPVNDDCDGSIAIVDGVHAFDLTEATTSGLGSQCFLDYRVAHDVFYCFEATVDGMVTITTCGWTELDTRIALWAGCACPDPDLDSPICCADNECDKQSTLTCEVECGKKYMIQFGSASEDQVGTGSFELFMDGVPCDNGGGGGSTPPSGPCDECGEGDPGWLEGAGFAGGQLLLFTRDAVSDAESPILAFDLTDELSAPTGSNWTPPMWTHPDWTRANLGTVFGVAIDGTGRAFVAHTSIYNAGFPRDAVGALGGPGAIYAIDAATGAPTLFAQLPQSQDPAIVPVSESWPGIGNIAWDFDRDVLFASNFDDGRIYRIDAAGTVLDAWDHATDVVTGGAAPEVGDAAGFAPLGERVWAVAPTIDRLYYSIWVEDVSRTDAARSNEIWSVQLDGSGAIVAGTRQLEIEMPNFGGSYSSPVSDLAFDADCCLLTAERSMSGDTTSTAHQSRGLRFCHDGTDWTLGTDYQVGAYGNGDNTAGGVDFDNGPVANAWFSADAIIFPNPYLYGATGIPVAGDVPANALMIDVDQDVSFGEKFQMGSLEISCFRDVSDGPCLDLVGELDCRVDADGISTDYDLVLTVTNNSDTAAQYLLIAGPVNQPVTTFVPPLLPGETRDVPMIVLGPIADEVVCFEVTLYDADFDLCCGLDNQQLCLVVPECDCAVDQQWTINCVDEAAGIYEFSFNLVNLTPDVIEHVFLVTDNGAPFTLSPNHIDVPSTPQFGSMFIGPIQVQTSLAPGDTIAFVATLHVANLFECCGLPLEFTLPPCEGGSTGNPADIDGDGVVTGADLGLIFANWGGSGTGDINGDGVVDAADLGLVLVAFGG